jgi:hypothetical protein
MPTPPNIHQEALAKARARRARLESAYEGASDTPIRCNAERDSPRLTTEKDPQRDLGREQLHAASESSINSRASSLATLARKPERAKTNDYK